MASRAEEEHARIVLEDELGVEFQHHDDGSKSSMPDLLSLDGNHVAEVITTTPSAVREAHTTRQCPARHAAIAVPAMERIDSAGATQSRAPQN